MSSKSSSPMKSQVVTQNYQEELPDSIGSFRRLLEDYSHVAADEVDDHLHKIRDKAWAVARFPCIGMWSFTDLKHVKSPTFEAAIARLKKENSEDVMLDVACGLGQVLRKLAADGIDPTKLFGIDLLPSYLELGFELFQDRDRFPSGNFVSADLLGPSSGAMAALEGKMTIIHAANFFHLFDWDQQIQIVLNILKLTQPRSNNLMIFGRQIGRLNAGEMTSLRSGNVRYLHNINSMQKIWDEIGLKTGARWRVEAEWLGTLPFLIPGFPDDAMYLDFAIHKE